MNDKTTRKADKGESFVYGSDFIILSGKEKRIILKTAKNLLKLQRENNVVLTDALSLQIEGKKGLR